MAKVLRLDGQTVKLNELISAVREHLNVKLSVSAVTAIRKSRQVVEKVLSTNQVIYGLNTGFGKLANQRISSADLSQLQKNLIRSHAAGVGDYLSRDITRLIMLLKINSLARGYSGIRLEVVERLREFYNKGLYPAIHSQGSVGASGDLAPLADLALTLTGEGCFIKSDGETEAAAETLQREKLRPVVLHAKEGLSLINGTQVSTALAIQAFTKATNLLDTLTILGAFSTEVMLGTDTAFRAEIQIARNQKGQKKAAEILYRTLQHSGFRESHVECDRVQDFYSLRCIPQVHGSAYDALDYGARILEREINSATDNPLTLTETGEMVSGGNFHAAPIAHLLDFLAIVITDVGSMSERRIAAFQDTSQSQLPMFLAKQPGLNSGFMLTQVTAAALVNENKILAHPASVDSIPTSANQEDHVSMAPTAGRKLLTIIENCENIAAIEYLCCGEAADFRPELSLAPVTAKLHQILRSRVPFIQEDRIMSPLIKLAVTLIRREEVVAAYRSFSQNGVAKRH